MADPAFILIKKPVDTESFCPQANSNGINGLNISPLIERYMKNRQNMGLERIQFIYDAAAKGLRELLASHVVPLDGTENNSDATYMAGMLTDLLRAGSTRPTCPLVQRLTSQAGGQLITFLYWCPHSCHHCGIVEWYSDFVYRLQC